jgi:uncharacterized protein YbaA (DUF1428 family)
LRAWIVYRNHDERDRINEKVIQDPRIKDGLKDVMDPAKLPFDRERMFWGGFETMVELESKR